MSTASNKPVAKINMWPVSAVIWCNGSDDKQHYSVTFERSYKDQDGQWKRTKSFNDRDLLLLAKAADQAHSRIQELQAAQRAEKPAAFSEPEEENE